jgi:hypothetical protein
MVIGCPWGTHDCITAEHFNFPHIPVSIVGITKAGWKLLEIVVAEVNDKFVQPAKEQSIGCNQESEKQIHKHLVMNRRWLTYQDGVARFPRGCWMRGQLALAFGLISNSRSHWELTLSGRFLKPMTECENNKNFS